MSDSKLGDDPPRHSANVRTKLLVFVLIHSCAVSVGPSITEVSTRRTGHPEQGCHKWYRETVLGLC